jgi:curved DNA-binding protein CbpA
MSEGPFKDYYLVLEVKPGAGPRTIRAAYRRLSKIYHPDVASDPHATHRMQEINEAYHVLSSRIRRLRYDYARSTAPTRAVPKGLSSSGYPSGPRARLRSSVLDFRVSIRPFRTFLSGFLEDQWPGIVLVALMAAFLLALPPQTRTEIIIVFFSMFNPGALH